MGTFLDNFIFSNCSTILINGKSNLPFKFYHKWIIIHEDELSTELPLALMQAWIEKHSKSSNFMYLVHLLKEKVLKEQFSFMFIPQVTGYERVEFKDIIYATIKKDIISLVLKDQVIKKYKGKMKDLEKILSVYSFLLINRHEIVNIMEIRYLSLEDTITMNNGEILEVSRDRLKHLKKRLFIE